MMSRPEHSRTASTNLVGGSGYRVLEGKIGIVTGGSRGKCGSRTNSRDELKSV